MILEEVHMNRNSLPWLRRLSLTASRSLRWLIPGLGVKRWLLLTLGGTTLIGVGLAIVILDVYRTAPETWWLPALSTASLRFIARPLRALIFGGMGLAMIIIGIYGINRSILSPYLRRGQGHAVVDTLSQHRRRGRGPRIAAIGGGTGLSTLLRGLKSFTSHITAIVSVSDDGGSSGRIRRETGILPPGDIRNCLAALSSDEALLAQLFQYRFPDGEEDLDGHSFGNLFITALADITGSFEAAVAESGRVLAIDGRVLPSTLHNVRLVADIKLPHVVAEVRIQGESHIPEAAGSVRRVWLEPNNPPAFPEAVRAILSADLVVVGPGSLFTSILPNLLVPDLEEALRATRAVKIYVCNVATQLGETQGYTCGDHIRALEGHVGSSLFDVVLANAQYEGELPGGSEWVIVEDNLDDDYPVHRADLVSQENPWRHDSDKLSKILIDILTERTGPLVE